MAIYPERLIPKAHEEIIETLDDEFILGRANRNTNKDLYDSRGYFRFKLIPLKQIPHLSCNIQQLSDQNDLKIELAGSCKRLAYIKWKSGDPVPNPDEIEFSINNDWQLYFFRVGDIKVNTNYEFEGESYEIALTAIHDPLIINYSHAEFYIYDERREKNPDSASSRMTNFSSKKEKPGQEVIMFQLRRALRKKTKTNLDDFR